MATQLAKRNTRLLAKEGATHRKGAQKAGVRYGARGKGKGLKGRGEGKARIQGRPGVAGVSCLKEDKRVTNFKGARWCMYELWCRKNKKGR